MYYLPLLIVQFSGVKYTHIIVQPISRTLSPYKTETLHKLNNYSSFSPFPQCLPTVIGLSVSMRLTSLVNLHK